MTGETGKWGEKKAAAHLEKLGYKIICMNYRTRFGEIDIIASKDEILAFIEVKLRKNSNFAAPREYVDYRKQKKLRISAEIWLSKNKTALQPRFDVIEIYARDGINSPYISIKHIKDAFY